MQQKSILQNRQKRKDTSALVRNVLLTDCMQEVVVMCEGHQWVWQLPQPLLYQACHCVDGIVFEAGRVGV